MSIKQSSHIVEETGSTVENAETQPINKSFVAELFSLVKIGIINSNVMTTFAGIWLALYYTDSSITSNWIPGVLVLLGSALLMAGACTINNYYDRDIDAIMERTQSRPTVTGRFSNSFVIAAGVAFTFLGLAMLFSVNATAGVIGLVGWFFYVVLYTMWSKRRYTLNTVVGSVPGAVPPLIGWAAIDPTLSHPAAWILFMIMFLWQTPHFLSLAIKKTEDYRKAGIPMLPVVYGFAMTKRQILIYMVCLLPLPFYLASLGTIFLIVATLLNVGWIFLTIYGMRWKDKMKWATGVFVYSLNYLTIMVVLMVVVTLPHVLLP
ncbi:heme o synthase [Aureibacillus halotolerans]|uniref:Protoheme IX farnesyltransferase n=1 Tax=Aureibacillus halotolerans TaxID=1508390 RepID=A0A4R6U944_9BACI|nr:protoheme IX farnesyltransferase [Aureibacillus halotolerans]